ncbi:MAG: endonuclease domain-containing protein [Oscillospiraceae bacterium]|nr:endonuclease domain-containing protein [Oscillospiraceae bacterium]
MHYGKNHTNLPNARSLRKNMTKEERHLWYDFLRYCRPRFRRQELISNYIVDFFCHQARLAVELDGSQHSDPDSMKYDAQRTAHLRSLGITVIRFSNLDVTRNFEGVCQQILLLLESLGFHPSVTFGDSSPQGEP